MIWCKLWSLHRIYSQVWCWWIISVSVWGHLLLFIIDPFLFSCGLWSERLSSWSTLSVSLCAWLRCLLFIGKSKMKWDFIPSQACCSLNRRLLTCGISCVSWVLDNMMSESSCGLWRWQKLRILQIWYNCLLEVLSKILYTYLLHPQKVADEVSV
jgi:hypothetical protein